MPPGLGGSFGVIFGPVTLGAGPEVLWLTVWRATVSNTHMEFATLRLHAFAGVGLFRWNPFTLAATLDGSVAFAVGAPVLGVAASGAFCQWPTETGSSALRVEAVARPQPQPRLCRPAPARNTCPSHGAAPAMSVVHRRERPDPA